MARLSALSLLKNDGVTPELLAELYGKVIENVQVKAVSMYFKNRDLSGDFAAGSVEAKRFVNSASQAYGTARTAGAGVAVQAKPVVVAKDTEKEIIEEIESKDLNEYGVTDLLNRRRTNHVASMVRELDTAFFAKGYEAGDKFTPTGGATTWFAKIEELVVKLEKVSNPFVDGVPRELIGVAVTPEVYSAIRQELDMVPASENAWGRGDIGMLHDIAILKSNHLPKETGQVVSAMAMVQGAIAQPVHIDEFDVERIQLSKAYAIELFYDFGTQAVMEDLIFYIGDEYSAGS